MKTRLFAYLFLSATFLAAGLFSHYFFRQYTSDETLAKSIAANLKDELAAVDEDLTRLPADFDLIDQQALAYPIFFYRHNALVYWTDNTFVPPPLMVADTFKTRLTASVSESYLLKRKQLSNDVVAIAAIKLLRNYPITNDYFSPEYNERILPSASVRILEPNASAGQEVCVESECLFRVEFHSEALKVDRLARIVTFILFAVAVVFFIAAAFELLPRVSNRISEVGFFFLLGVFAFLRLVLSQTGFPGNFLSSSLFDPQVFAVSYVNASLGDLLINLLAVMILSFYVFRNYFRFHIQRLKGDRLMSWGLGIFSGLCILFAGLFPVVVIQTLYNNSAIVIDISQSLQFDVLRLIAMGSVLMSGICAFLFSHAFIRTLISIGHRGKVIACFLIAVVIFSVINELTEQQYAVALVLSAMYFFAVYFLKLYNRLKTLNFGTFGYLFVAIFFLSIIGAYAIQHFTQKEKIDNQFRFASNFLIDRDYFAEYLLYDASRKISHDAFIQSRIASPFFGKEAIRQKIRQIFLPSYFN
ncbi:MAG TPA: hypothetical protein VEB86_08630, partial [Chryseosolibacter sp.]|nr:hypothetical protein [Chryseosolibacter sp.]